MFKPMTATCLAIACAAFGAPSVEAQSSGSSYYGYYYDQCYWYPSLDAALGSSSTPTAVTPRIPGTLTSRFRRRIPKKYIFAYIHPVNEVKDPNIFKNSDLVRASRGAWAFVKIPFEKGNPLLKTWRVSVPGTVAALDLKGNHFISTRNFSIGGMRNFLKGMPTLIAKYKMKVASDYKRALSTLTRDKKRGIKALVKFIKEGKPGYKEVEEATARLNEMAEGEFKQAELAASVNPADGIEFLEGVAKTYLGTPPEAQALIAIARLQRSIGRVQEAIQTLVKVSKLDPLKYRREIATAEFLMGEISREGEVKIAKAADSAEGRAKAREELRKLMKEYEGTPAGERATELYRRLD